MPRLQDTRHSLLYKIIFTHLPELEDLVCTKLSIIWYSLTNCLTKRRRYKEYKKTIIRLFYVKFMEVSYL